MKKNKRVLKVDFLRGLAILSMILTHVVALLYKGDSAFMGGAILWGVDISYFTFLFLFAYIYGMKISKNSVNNTKEVKRAISIYVVYLLLAFWIWIFIPSRIDWMGAITFRILPEFIDFLPSFAFLTLLVVIFKPVISNLLKKEWLFIILSLIIYALSTSLYTLTPSNEFILILKANLVGHESLHTFGIFSYLPIFVLGLITGSKQVKNEKINWGAIFIASAITMPLIKYLGLSDWERWAPSVYFHLIGLSFASFILWIYEYIPLTIRKVLSFIEWIGRRPLDFYIYHILLLIPLVLILNAPISSIFLTILVYILVIICIKVIIKWKEIN